MLEVIKLKHNTPEWLEFRNGRIGASDAAAVLGRSNWKSNQELWEEKIGLRKHVEFPEDERIGYGAAVEELNLKLFAVQYADKYKVKTNKTVVYVKDGFQFASLDGELEDIKTGELGIYEGKEVWVDSSLVWEKWKNKIPDQYYCQVLHQLLTTGRKFVVLNPTFRWIDRDGEIATKTRRITIRLSDAGIMEDIKYLDEAEHEFQEYVKRKERPPRLLPPL